MSYLVLARKYRPQTFEQVIEQDHVTRTLSNAISSDRVAHAVLFSGPEGNRQNYRCAHFSEGDEL